MLTIPVAIRAAPYLGMVDKPDARKVHARPIPRVGGVGITLGAVIPLMFLLPHDDLLRSFLIASTVLFVFGAWDDATELGHWLKFVGQFFAVGIVVFYGGLWVERFPFLDGAVLPASIGKPFTILAMVGVINAINHSDGLDGLAGGESLLSLIVMGFLAYMANDTLGVLISCAVAGGVLGFLRFNTHPAIIFMGDAGSQFLGFAIGFLAVYLTQVAHPALSPALPLLLIGLPIADINAVFYLRVSGGMNWFKATRNHVHHRLLDLGFEHYETVVIIYSIQALLVVTAVVLKYQSDWAVIGAFILFIAVLFAALTMAERRNIDVAVPSERRALGRLLGSIRSAGDLPRLAENIVVIFLSALLVIGALVSREVDTAVGLVAGGLFVAAASSFAVSVKRSNSLIFRFSAQSLAVLIVYLTVQFPSGNTLQAMAMSTPVFIVLGIVLAIAIRMTSEDVFKTTATDYLILFGLITVSIFGRDTMEVRQISDVVTHSVIAIYACEFSCRAVSTRKSPLPIAVIASLGVFAVRGLA